MPDNGESRIVQAGSLEPDERDHGRRTFRQFRLSHATPGAELGASLYELDPGRRTWPAHYHTANEEAVYVLDGSLRLWTGQGEDRDERTVDAGDYAALPTGPDHAHEVEAAGEDPARFLVLSTMREPDFTVLPDGRKARLIAGDPPGEFEDRYVSKTVDFDAEVEYWDDGDAVDAEAAEDGAADGGDSSAQDPQTDGGTPAAGDRVVSVADLDWTERDPPRQGHRFRRKQLRPPAGGEDLGTSLYELDPGMRAWLPHYHTGNEEAIYVLEGEGTVVLGPGREEYDLSPGDYVALPAGEDGYHDVVAGDEGLRYLMVSTMNEPDITVYPEDDMVGLYAGSAPGGDSRERTISTYLDSEAEVQYWKE